MEKERKQIWVPMEEPSDTKAKIAVVCVSIALGIMAFMVFIYGIIPALLS